MSNELLLDHFANPRNAGELPPPAITVEVSNPACGDILRLSVACMAGKVVATRFKTRGCVASIAASSALTELLSGCPIEELPAINRGQIEAAIGGLAPESQHASLLCVDAVREVVRQMRVK